MVPAEQICENLRGLWDNGSTLEEVLSAAVNRLHESDPRFDWTGIYELYPDDVLRLGPFVGDPTDHVSIAVGHGVCGAAVAEKCNQNIPDVSRATNYLACSAATRSELVVLIRENDRIYAQIDIDSHEVNAFDSESVRAVEKIADCLADLYTRIRFPGTPPSPRPPRTSP